MTGRKLLKRQKLRNNEYYDMQSVFDELYENIHNYYRMATAASPDIQRLAFEIKISIKTGCKSE